jgi:hypothetical protein
MRAIDPHFRSDEIDNCLGTLTGALLNTRKGERDGQSKKGRNRRPLKRWEGKEKLANYRRCQQLLANNKKRLAEAFFNNTDPNLRDVGPP